MVNNFVDNKPEIIVCADSTDYADGAEQKLQTFFASNDVDEYTIKPDKNDWPMLYHLTPVRKNLLNWLDFGKSYLNILELGAGCGAITSYLVNLKNSYITAVEGALPRAKVIQQRCKHANNLKIYVDNIKDFNSNIKYDIVTLIGVLEYAGVYDHNPDPFLNTIKKAYNLLKKDGTLLLAIENQIGYKYLAGYPEDHYGWPYESINGYPAYNGMRTFEQVTLHKLLQNAGFNYQAWYYPCPDYKLPNIILSEKAFINTDFDFLPLLDLPTIDYSVNIEPVFNERTFLKSMTTIGQVKYFMNSFFIIASKAKKSEIYSLNEKILSVKINVSDRSKEFQTKTYFIMDEKFKIKVKREKLHPEIETSFSTGRHILEKQYENYYGQYVNLADAILDAICNKDDNMVRKYISIWHNKLYEFLEGENQVYEDKFNEFCNNHFNKKIYRKNKQWIDGKYIDFHPGNILYSIETGKTELVDMEWQLNLKLPAQLVFDRGLGELSYKIRRQAKFISNKLHSTTYIPLDLYNQLDDLPLLKSNDMDSWSIFENWFQSAVINGNLDYQINIPVDVSLDILIVTYNSAKFIEKCILSIKRYIDNPNIHIIDNNSSDGTQQIIERLNVKTKICNKDNLKLSKVWNKFLKISRAKYILLLNPDIIIHKSEFIDYSIQLMQENPKYIAAGRVHHTTLGSLSNWIAPVCPDDRHIFIKKVFESPWYRNMQTLYPDWRLIPYDYFDGCCVMIDREKILGIGGFCEELPLYFNDSEILLRIKQSGYEIGSSWDNDDGSFTHFLYGSSKITEVPMVSEYILPSSLQLEKITPSIKVSVILPTYNHLQFLPKAVKSILEQTFSNFELIIVNDGSTDGTYEYLNTLHEPRIRVIHQENKHLPEALNTGIRISHGEFLTWTSADNYCAPVFLEALVAALEAYPDAGFAYSAFAVIDEHDRITQVTKNQDLSYHYLLTYNPGNASFMYRRTCQEKVGLYDPEVEGAEDWDMWIRIVEQFPTVYIPEILYYYRVHKQSISAMQYNKNIVSCKSVFLKAINRKEGNINLLDFYPCLSICRDRRMAEFHALIDFSYSLLSSEFTDINFICNFLETVVEKFPDLVYVKINLAIAYIRSGQLNKAVSIVRNLHDVDIPIIQNICQRINSAYISNKLDLLSGLQIFSLDKISSELFQLEEEHKLIFSFTNNFYNVNTYYKSQLNQKNYNIIEKANDLYKHEYVTLYDKSLSILHTAEFYYPHIGGAETVVQQVSERLVKRGHKVTVATTRLRDRNFTELNGVRIKEFSVEGSMGTGFKGEDIDNYQNFLLDYPCDVMMNYAAQQWATDLAFNVIEKIKGVKIIAPCGYSALLDSHTIRWPQFTDYFTNVIPKILPLYDGAIYHSAVYKDYEYAKNYGFKNGVIIPNGIDEDEFTVKPSVDFREKYNIKTKYLGLCVANFYEGKGQDRVIECVKKMKRKDFTMVFIGKEGDLLDKLKVLTSGLKVLFLVNIPREDTVAAYHSADIFIFGSHIEASPLVIIEAKASKTPFVSTDCGNVREWKGGIVCNADDMAANVNKILNDKSLRKRLAEEGYKEWKEYLTWDIVVDKYEELYLRLYHEKVKGVKTSLTVWTDELKLIQKKIEEDYSDLSLYIKAASILLKDNCINDAMKYIEDGMELDSDNKELVEIYEKMVKGL
ncbi:MAG: glycosyltransferase [Candidatus Eremiobacterota bacterium]